MGTESTSILFVFVAIAGAALLVQLPREVRVPVVVAEIGLGIVIGPDVLDLSQVGTLGLYFSNFGLAFLFFLVGMELDLARVKGRPLNRACIGWAISVGLGVGAGAALNTTSLIDDPLPVAIALSTTALTTLAPILRDAGESHTTFGTAVFATGTIGEFGPIVLISLFLTAGHGTALALLLLGVFGAVAGLAFAVALTVRPGRVVRAIERTLHATGQVGLRLAMLTLAALVFLTEELGLDLALGAFTAGMLVGMLLTGESGRLVRFRLEGIGWGFLVPIFFVVSGMQFDLDALLSGGRALALLPLFAFALLVIRGVPSILLLGRDVGRAGAVPLALCAATGLPLIVAVTQLALAQKEISTDVAAALVGAGMLSVLLYPLGALTLRRRGGGGTPPS